VYPLLAIAEFGWLMTGSEVNKKSIEWADDNIIRLNPYLKEHFKGPIRL
jgi:23S rRNA A1618 N6-methylase RlmF